MALTSQPGIKGIKPTYNLLKQSVVLKNVNYIIQDC